MAAKANSDKKAKKTTSKQSTKQSANKKPNQLRSKILRGVGYTFGVIAVLLVLAVIFRDTLIKNCITGVGSWATGLNITVGNFDTSLTEGSVTIENLCISNPEGFNRPLLLELGRFHVDADMGSLLSQTIILEKIEVSDLHFVSEFTKDNKFNLGVVNENIQKRFGKVEPKPENAPEPPPAAEDKYLLIRDMNISLSLIMQHDMIGLPLSLPISYKQKDMKLTISEKSDDFSFVRSFNDFVEYMEYITSSSIKAGGLIVDTGKTVVEKTKQTTQQVFDKTKQATQNIIKLLDFSEKK